MQLNYKPLTVKCLKKRKDSFQFPLKNENNAFSFCNDHVNNHLTLLKNKKETKKWTVFHFLRFQTLREERVIAWSGMKNQYPVKCTQTLTHTLSIVHNHYQFDQFFFVLPPHLSCVQLKQLFDIKRKKRENLSPFLEIFLGGIFSFVLVATNILFSFRGNYDVIGFYNNGRVFAQGKQIVDRSYKLNVWEFLFSFENIFWEIWLIFFFLKDKEKLRIVLVSKGVF